MIISRKPVENEMAANRTTPAQTFLQTGRVSWEFFRWGKPERLLRLNEAGKKKKNELKKHAFKLRKTILCTWEHVNMLKSNITGYEIVHVSWHYGPIAVALLWCDPLLLDTTIVHDWAKYMKTFINIELTLFMPTLLSSICLFFLETVWPYAFRAGPTSIGGLRLWNSLVEVGMVRCELVKIHFPISSDTTTTTTTTTSTKPSHKSCGFLQVPELWAPHRAMLVYPYPYRMPIPNLQVVSDVEWIKQVRSETVEDGNNADSVQAFSALIKLTFN